MNRRKWCTVPECTVPVGECSGACWHPEEKQMTLDFDEERVDIIGQNGPTGEHYGHNGSVRVTVIENGKVDLEYIASWNGDRKDVLQRAGRLLAMLVKES